LETSWYSIDKNPLETIFRRIRELGYRVIAPIRLNEDHVVLDFANKFDEVSLDFIRPRNNPKSFLFPNEDTLLYFDYRSQNIKSPLNHSEKLALFCIHPCDANAIYVLDKMLLDPPEDPYYMLRRRNLMIVVLDCEKADDYCFCESVESRVPRVYDLWIVPSSSKYFISIGSRLGSLIIDHLPIKKDRSPEIRELNVKKYSFDWSHLRDLYDNEVWRELSEQCVLCGSCLSSCPTCVCFDVVDRVSHDLNACRRVRVWDSCIFRTFTMLAGGRIVRKSPEERFKFRFYHKFVFIKERYGVFGCTGCGRCISRCSSHIHPLEVVSEVLRNA